MEQDIQPVQESKAAPTFNDSVACEVCGRFGAYRLGDRWLCQECYTGSGSCCSEFGKNNLWEFLTEDRCPSTPPGNVTSQ